MFSERMSSSELLNEYLKDLPELQSRTQRFDESNYMAGYLRKHRKQQEVTVEREFATSRGNRYLGVVVHWRVGPPRNCQWAMSARHIGLMKTSRGLHALMFYADSDQALKLRPHFFRRYKERLLPVCDWQTRIQLTAAKNLTDLIGLYTRRNPAIVWIEAQRSFTDKTHIFAPVNDGIALLQWDKNKRVLQANTFITSDMLDERQVKMAEYASAYLSMTDEQRKLVQPPDFACSQPPDNKAAANDGRP